MIHDRAWWARAVSCMRRTETFNIENIMKERRIEFCYKKLIHCVDLQCVTLYNCIKKFNMKRPLSKVTVHVSGMMSSMCIKQFKLHRTTGAPRTKICRTKMYFLSLLTTISSDFRDWARLVPTAVQHKSLALSFFSLSFSFFWVFKRFFSNMKLFQ